MKTHWLHAATALFLLAATAQSATEAVGVRPYELTWANRTNESQPPLVDFENLAGWRVECKNAEAQFERTREQQIWGQHVGKLTYRGTGTSPEVRILPPAPIVISNSFDAVTLWCYGNNWGWTTDPSTPRVSIAVLFEDSEKKKSSACRFTTWTGKSGICCINVFLPHRSNAFRAAAI